MLKIITISGAAMILILIFLSYIAKIMALSEIYGSDKVARAIEDAFQFAAFSSSDYMPTSLNNASA